MRVLFGIITAYILVLVLLVDRKKEYAWRMFLRRGSNWMLLLIAAALVCLVVFLLRKWGRVPRWAGSHAGLLVSLGAVLLVAVQLYMAYCIYFRVGWDVEAVTNTAMALARGEGFGGWDYQYYSWYPTNAFLPIVQSWILRAVVPEGLLSKTAGLLFVLAAASCIAVDAAAGFALLSVRRLTGRSGPVWAALAMLLPLLVFHPYVVVPYSDTFVMPFTTLAYLLWLGRKGNRSDLVRWFFIGLLITVGALIKMTAYIVLIAMVIFSAVRFFANANKKKALPRMGAAVLAVVLAFGLSQGVCRWALDANGFWLDEEQAMGATHFLMMGMNPYTDGSYSSDDVQFSQSFFFAEERTQANLEVIKQRIRERDASDWLDFYVRKTLMTYNDGTFFWGFEGNHFLELYDNDDLPLAPFFRSLFYYEGSNLGWFHTVSQAVWLMVLCGTALSLLRRKGESYKEQEPVCLLQLILVGVFFYLMLFEGRSRYLFSFVPVFVTAAAVGFDRLYRSRRGRAV